VLGCHFPGIGKKPCSLDQSNTAAQLPSPECECGTVQLNSENQPFPGIETETSLHWSLLPVVPRQAGLRYRKCRAESKGCAEDQGLEGNPGRPDCPFQIVFPPRLSSLPKWISDLHASLLSSLESGFHF
jgi:hypothetical protein